MSSEDFLVEANITGEEFWFFEITCRVASWLAQGETNTRGYDVVQKMYNFLETAGDNQTEAWDKLGPYLGTTPERAQFVNAFYGGEFPSAAESVLKVLPMAGHPVSSNGVVAGVFGFLTVIMLLFLGLRLYSRRVIHGYILGYDWVLIAATLVTLSYGLLNSITISTSSYNRLWCDRTWRNYVVELQGTFATHALYATSIFLIKASLLWFYWSLTAWWPLRAATIVTAVVALGNSLAMIFIYTFNCSPIAAYEGEDFFTAECKQELWLQSEIINGSINIATDLIIWLIPLPMIWKITQSWRERILSCATFGVGALACIACGFRFKEGQDYRGNYLVPPDQARYLVWSITEMCLAIICSCAPAIRALVLKKAPAIIGATTFDEEDKADEKDSKDLEKSNTTSVVITARD